MAKQSAYLKYRRRAIKERIIEDMKLDFLAGMTKGEIYEQYKLGNYGKDVQDDFMRVSSDATFNKYWKEMVKNFGKELEGEKEELRRIFFEKYNDLYKRNIKKERLKDAKDIVDSLVKLTGCDAPEKKEVNFNGQIEIDFGFNEEDEDKV